MQTQLSTQTTPRKRKNAVPIYDQHIVVSPGVRGGKPRITGRRITVADVVDLHLKRRQSVDEIVHEFNLTYAQVYAALTYYYDHLTEIEEREVEESTAVEAIKQSYPSKLQAKLNSRD